MQFHDYPSTFVSSTLRKDKLHTTVTASWDFISLTTFMFVKQCKPTNKTKQHNFALLILDEENPLMTNGLASQRDSNKKNINHAIPRLQVYRCFINTMQKNLQPFHHMSFMVISSSLATLLFAQQPVRNPPVVVHGWPMRYPRKGPAMWKAFIIRFQNFRSTFVGKTNYTQQWQHKGDLGFHLTGNSIVCSTPHTGITKGNIIIPHNWSFMGRQYWWPMESPHKGPALPPSALELRLLISAS